MIIFREFEKEELTKNQEQIITYDPINNNILLLHSWSFSHQLLPNDTEIILEDRPTNCPYIENWNEFQSIANGFASQNYKGSICYMIGYKIDHKDNHYGNKFEMTVAQCDYSEALAVSPYLKKHQNVISEIIAQVNKNPC